MNDLLNASANLVAAAHLGYFLFVLGGAIAIVAGARRRWGWVRNVWFRAGHAAAVFIVLIEEVTGVPCPLNLVQARLRMESIGEEQATAGMGGVLDFLLYQTISPPALAIFYWVMGATVALLLWTIPIRRRRDVAAGT